MNKICNYILFENQIDWPGKIYYLLSSSISISECLYDQYHLFISEIQLDELGFTFVNISIEVFTSNFNVKNMQKNVH